MATGTDQSPALLRYSTSLIKDMSQVISSLTTVIAGWKRMILIPDKTHKENIFISINILNNELS